MKSEKRIQYVQNIRLDISGKSQYKYIDAKQGDNASRFLKITMYSDGYVIKPSAGETAIFRCLKPDGHSCINPAVINEDGTMTVELTSQVLAVKGLVNADISIMNGESVISTATFFIQVEQAPVSANTAASSDEFLLLVEKVDESIVATNAANDATERANTAASLATNSANNADDATEEAQTATREANSATSAAISATNSANSAAEAANTATTNAERATEAANTAADRAEQAASAIFDELTANDTSYDNTISGLNGETVQEAIDELSSSLDNLAGVTLKDVTSWGKVQEIVRAGLADKVFNVGDQFTVMKGSTPLVFDVIGIDHDIPTDSTKTHSMTLQLHDCLMSLQFDNKQALYYAESELLAGTYNFTLLAGYDVAYGGGKTLQFTLTQPVPAGGQICFPWGFNIQSTATDISTYASQTSTTVIETVPVTEGTGGIALSPTNHSHRIRYGSNNYAESPMRQWLNSDGVAGSVWTPSTIYSRPPSWVTDTAGFLNGMDEEFISVIGEVKKITARNTLTDGGGSIDSDEKIFLLSRSEVYAGNENNINEGNAYPYYSENSDLPSAGAGADTNRIKYLSDVARHWWLRSPNTSHAAYVRFVKPVGSLDFINTSSNLGVAPACCII